MENCFLKETKKYKKIPLFFFLYFHFPKGMDSFWVNKEELHIFYMPFLKSNKNYQKIINYLKEKGVKKVCTEHIENEILLKKIKENFKVITGEKSFFLFFEKIIDKFMKMHSLLYEESEIVFLSERPEHAKKYIKLCIKKFKKVSIYTKKKESFKKLSEHMLKTYGTEVFLKDKKEYPQKRNRIYINLEKNKNFNENFFKNVYFIDIYRQYKNAFCEVLFLIPFQENSLLKEEKIHKNLFFADYMMKKCNINIQKEWKIVNIKRID